MRKPKTGTVTREQIAVEEKVCRSTPTRELDATEEQALRMRHGIGLDADAPLPSKAEGHPEAERALLEMEAKLLRAARQRAGIQIEEDEQVEETEIDEQEHSPRPRDSRVKAKIVRALRKKG